MSADIYPDVLEPNLVGTYSPVAKAGGGYVWGDVLEYRVWCHPERGSPDLEDGNDYYHPFATNAEALAFSQRTAITLRTPAGGFCVKSRFSAN